MTFILCQVWWMCNFS